MTEHLVSSVLTVRDPIAPLRGVNTPPVMTRPLLLGTDTELLRLAADLVTAVTAVLVIVAPPSPGYTFPSVAPEVCRVTGCRGVLTGLRLILRVWAVLVTVTSPGCRDTSPVVALEEISST